MLLLVKLLLWVIIMSVILKDWGSFCEAVEKKDGNSLPAKAAETPVQLIVLAVREEIIYKLLKDRITQLKLELSLLEKYCEDYEESSLSILELSRTKKSGKLDVSWTRGYYIASHPILSYRMIHRYSDKILAIKKLLSLPANTNAVKEALQMDRYIQNHSLTIQWPNEHDLMEAMNSILEIHHIYSLNVKEFTSGRVMGVETGVHLNAYHTTKIGMFALEAQMYSLGIEWLAEARQKIMQDNDKSISADVVTQVIHLATKMHDDAWRRLPESYIYLFNNTLIPKDKSDSKPTVSLKRRDLFVQELSGKRFQNSTLINYLSLCSGKNFQTEEEKSNLFCYYDQNSTAALLISPAKKEILSLDPLIIQIYDVIGNKLIAEITRRAENLLERSRVRDEQTLKPKISEIRTSTQTFLFDEDIPQLQPVSKIIHELTGLDNSKVRDWEMLQVVSYVFGRYYLPHLDSPDNFSDATKAPDLHRIATFLIYLNDVQLGGYTAFPMAGTFARPVKGSAVFWYNLKRSGVSHIHTWHGACPVLLGIKWVANKWIDYNSQFRFRSCTLNSNE